MDKAKLIKKHITEGARVEKEILRSARHPFLVRLRYAFQSTTKRAARVRKTKRGVVFVTRVDRTVGCFW